jgi:molybdenum cofactor cytidylyltransferase
MRLTDAFEIEDGDVVTFVGAGGKTTTMFKLAQEFSQRGKTVVITLTTEMFESEGRQAHRMILCDNFEGIRERLCECLQGGIIVTVASKRTKKIKLKGFDPQIVDKLTDIKGIDLILVEGDGAAKRAFKAPAGHEPVIPNMSTILVPIVGIDAIGKPLTSENAHRPEIISRMTNVKIGDLITSDAVATVLSHKEGGIKGAPPTAEVIPLVNKVETDRELETAIRVAQKTLRYANARIERVVIGHVLMDDPVICNVNPNGTICR